MKLRIVDCPFDAPTNDQGGVEPGEMFRYPPLDCDGREAWAVCLPNGAVWFTTEKAGNPPQFWDVTGEPPNITVRPSIYDYASNGWGNWHGFITDGELIPC